jgi:nucleotidyltransferase/DNA polymerase involved in DNA repair
MSDHEVTFSAPAAGPEGEGAGVEQKTEKQTQALDVDALIERVGKLVDDRLSDHDRRQQGLRRKQEDRIRKEYERLAGAAKVTGVELTEQHKQTLFNQATQAVLGEGEEEATEPAKPGKSEVTTPPAGQTTTAKTADPERDAIFKATGVTVNSEDPEAEELKGATSRDEWLQKLLAAALKKKQRQSTTPGARLPSLGSGGIPNNLEAQYQAEMTTVHGDVERWNAVREKYRKLGLKI